MKQASASQSKCGSIPVARYFAYEKCSNSWAGHNYKAGEGRNTSAKVRRCKRTIPITSASHRSCRRVGGHVCGGPRHFWL